MTQNRTSPTPTGPGAATPDLVDRIFEYLLAEVPEIAPHAEQLRQAVRAEFRGERHYIASRPATARQQQAAAVLSLFNGRNATEIARRLGIGRSTVYRILKQSTAPRPDFAGHGTP